MGKNKILNSIDDIYNIKHEHHLYEIHPTNTNVVSGYIETYNNNLIDWETKQVYTKKDIYEISVFEETHKTYYMKII